MGLSVHMQYSFLGSAEKTKTKGLPGCHPLTGQPREPSWVRVRAGSTHSRQATGWAVAWKPGLLLMSAYFSEVLGRGPRALRKPPASVHLSPFGKAASGPSPKLLSRGWRCYMSVFPFLKQADVSFLSVSWKKSLLSLLQDYHVQLLKGCLLCFFPA